MNVVTLLFAIWMITLKCMAGGGADERVVMRWEFEDSTEGWHAQNHMEELAVSGGVVRTRVTGPDAYMVTAVSNLCAEDVTDLRMRLRCARGGACQVLFATDLRREDQREEVPMFTCKGVDAWQEIGVDLSTVKGWESRIRTIRLDLMNGREGEGAEIEIDWIRLMRREPRIAVKSFARQRVLARPGEQAKVRLEVVNATGGKLPELSAVLLGQERAEGKLEEAARGQAVFTWLVNAGEEKLTRYRAEVWAEGRKVAEADAVGLGGQVAEMPAPSGRRWAGETGGWYVVETPVLSLAMAGGAEDVNGAVVRVRQGGQWQIAGVCAPLGAVQVASEGVGRQLMPALRVVRTWEGGVEAEGGVGEGVGRLRLRLSAGKREELIDAEVEFEALTNVTLVRLSGPVLLAGEGGFRKKKRGGLFPGLEYLEGEERSSDEAGVGKTFSLRVAPEPCEVCVPVMAVGTPQGGMMGMMWDATQVWDGVQQMLMAAYATPNFVDEQENHLMMCFVPTSPRWVVRNGLVARERYEMGSGQRVRVCVSVFYQEKAELEDVVPLVYEVQGQAAPPRSQRTPEEMLELCMRGWAETLYDKETDGFALQWRGGYEPVPMPQVKAALHAYARETGDERWARMANVATNARIVDLVEPLWNGIGARPPYVEEMLKDYETAGRWVYRSSEEVRKLVKRLTGGAYDSLGREGESQRAGVVAEPAMYILAHAHMTGDEEALAVGTNALEALKAFYVPKGAQRSDELHIDAPLVYPGILAADGYRFGYELTGERRYLEEALRWLRRGLPFFYSYEVPGVGAGAHVYLPDDPLTPELEAPVGICSSAVVFENPNRQFTPYGCIPVLGTSYYYVSWFGRVVQWIGVMWANAVYELMKHTNDTVLVQAADGLLMSAYEQMFDKAPAAGMLPDSWELRNNVMWSPHIAPMLVEQATRAKLDRPNYGMHRTVVVRTEGGGRRHITSRGGVYDARMNSGEVAWRQRFLAGEPCDAVVIGGTEPARVLAGARTVPRVADAAAVDEGWHYDAARKMLCLRVKQAGEYEMIVVHEGS